MTGSLVGYARVSTRDQNPDLQLSVPSDDHLRSDIYRPVVQAMAQSSAVQEQVVVFVPVDHRSRSFISST